MMTFIINTFSGKGLGSLSTQSSGAVSAQFYTIKSKSRGESPGTTTLTSGGGG